MQNKLLSSKISIKSTTAAILSSIVCPNIHECPKLKSIFLSINLHKNASNDFYCENLEDNLFTLCNQVATYSLAKKSDDNSKIRKGMAIALNATMRKKNMLTFLENVMVFALKNLRDFEGFRLNAFDKQGNYTFNNINRLAFSEIEFNENFREEKFNITFQIFSTNYKHCFLFLKMLGFPFIN